MSKVMNETEAIALLAACRPLAVKLASKGFDYKLTREDQQLLDGYRRVRTVGLAKVERLRQQAGLFQFDIMLLAAALMMETA
jgi:hypothetical protein